ncbi:MAG: Hsp20/alpha crystallin family protein [Candidatus Heimdallarchaeota archaeon]
MQDDFDEFIEKIKKYFKLDSDIFDMDFLFVPEKNLDMGKNPRTDDLIGFKVSYHFEPGMDKPEIKIEGNIDDDKIREMLKGVDISKIPNIKDVYNTNSTREIDASKLSLDSHGKAQESNHIHILEPYTEIHENLTECEIVVEIPGMDKENIIIKFKDKGRKLEFTAENDTRKYTKTIPLLFKSSEKDYEIEVNNGIAILKVRKTVK